MKLHVETNTPFLGATRIDQLESPSGFFCLISLAFNNFYAHTFHGLNYVNNRKPSRSVLNLNLPMNPKNQRRDSQAPEICIYHDQILRLDSTINKKHYPHTHVCSRLDRGLPPVD